MFQMDGQMCKTDKSVLAKKLMSRVEQSRPSSVDVEIINGFYALHRLGNVVPYTFDKLAENFLIKLCASDASDIHLVFDIHVSSSIKDCERQNQKDFDIPDITGPLQKRPGDFQKSLKNYKFREALVAFFCIHWQNSYLVSIFGENTDVLVILLENIEKYPSLKIWLMGKLRLLGIVLRQRESYCLQY